MSAHRGYVTPKPKLDKATGEHFNRPGHKCADMGGTWLGEGASCDDCAPTCQGDANADGTVDVFDLLKVIDGWGLCD